MGGSQTSKEQNQSHFTADGCVIVMSVKVKYTDEPLGKLRVIPDFLPLPKNLVFLDKEMTVERGIIMAGRAKKTEHAGPKKGSGAY